MVLFSVANNGNKLRFLFHTHSNIDVHQHYPHPLTPVTESLTHTGDFIGSENKSVPAGAMKAPDCVCAHIRAASVAHMTLVLIWGTAAETKLGSFGGQTRQRTLTDARRVVEVVSWEAAAQHLCNDCCCWLVGGCSKVLATLLDTLVRAGRINTAKLAIGRKQPLCGTFIHVQAVPAGHRIQRPPGGTIAESTSFEQRGIDREGGIRDKYYQREVHSHPTAVTVSSP